MSVSNFVPTIWSARIKRTLDASLVVANRANRDWEADARHGTAKINEAGDIPVNTHAKNSTVDYAEPYSTQQTLTLNQRKIAGVKFDDLDKIQANVNLIERYSARMGYSLAFDIDRYVAGLYSGAGAGNVSLDITAITASEIRNGFADAGALLTSNNVPAEGRWALLSPLFEAAMFKDTAITQATDKGDAVLAAGAIGKFMGFNLYPSNTLPGTGVTVTLTANASQGDTSLTVAALAGAIPAGTILIFGAGRIARVTAQADVSDTSVTVAKLTVDIASSSVATYVKVRKCMFGTNEAITFGQNLYPNVEALRDVSTTDDYVRAEQNYGALVVQPYALGTFTVTEAS